MTRRDVALLILILLLGAGITTAHKVRQGSLAPGVRVEGLEFLRGPLHTFSESADADWSDGDRVIVEAGHSDVQVQTWSEKKVHVELKKQLHGEKEEEAARQASDIRLRVAPSRGSVTIGTTGSRLSGLSSEFTVTIPEHSRLQVIADNGSVVVHGIKADVLVKTAHGDVEASDLAGSLEVVNVDGSISLHRIKGPVNLRTAHGDIEASDLAGPADVACEDGDISLSRVAGGVRVSHAHGEVGISQVDSEVHVNSRNADVTASDIRGSMEIVDVHGTVRVERAGADLKVTAPNCEIWVENLAGNLTATVEGDPLTATQVKGGVKIVASASSVTLTDVQGLIEVSGTHTPVEIIRPGADVEVSTTNQEITIASPAAGGFRIDARAEQGEVECDIDELHVPEDRPAHFAGSTGDGRLRYRLNTSHATISIQRTSSDSTEEDR
ncbi:MAG: DUF4097 domain-containing protein [Acidobacteria bacterium]|nr:DUF4097 domain-containing protein [Acidobacteriota bacterium]